LIELIQPVPLPSTEGQRLTGFLIGVAAITAEVIMIIVIISVTSLLLSVLSGLRSVQAEKTSNLRHDIY
jgi:hypothetical protein